MLPDDLVQEAFLRVLRYRDSFREESKFSTWLYRLTCNLCHDHWERNRRDRAVIDPRFARGTPPDSAIEIDERHATLEQAMAQLEPEQARSAGANAISRPHL